MLRLREIKKYSFRLFLTTPLTYEVMPKRRSYSIKNLVCWTRGQTLVALEQSWHCKIFQIFSEYKPLKSRAKTAGGEKQAMTGFLDTEISYNNIKIRKSVSFQVKTYIR